MSIKLTTHEVGDVVFVDAVGKLTLGEGTGALRSKINQLVRDGSRRIVLNMADVSYMDSAGLGELIGAHAVVTAAGGVMRLLHLARRVDDLLKLTKLYTVFETFDDETAAIASFPLALPVPAPASLSAG